MLYKCKLELILFFCSFSQREAGKGEEGESQAAGADQGGGVGRGGGHGERKKGLPAANV